MPRDKNGRFVRNSDGKSKVSDSQQLAMLLAENASFLRRRDPTAAIIDRRRDIDDECGYPKTSELNITQYRMLYDREAVANRVVQVWPHESWQVVPKIFETEDIDETTPFEQAWEDLPQQLNTQSWYQGKKGNPIWEYLKRADVLSGIGHYGVLLLGLDDGNSLEEPAEKGVHKLLYLRTYDAGSAQINQYEMDPTSERYGQPISYTLYLYDPTLSSPTRSIVAHWTRCIHLADNLGSSEVFGMPRMQPVFNRLYDLRKLYGGSAEMYWLGALPGISIETHPTLGGDVPMSSAEKTHQRDQLQNYLNGLQRYLSLRGMSAKSLSPQVVDPSPQVMTQIEAICIQLDIPKRIFMGSERGELASSQDTDTWSSRVQERQNNYLTPRVVTPLINRLIWLGVLPEPTSYSIEWGEEEKLSEEDQSRVALARTESLVKYIQGSGENLIAPMDFLTRILGFDEDTAETMLEARLEEIESESEDESLILPNEEEDESEDKSTLQRLQK